MNAPVSFEMKQLLYDKGWRYELGVDETGYRVEHSLAEQRWNECDLTYVDITIADAVMWLYEKHKIWISVELCIVGSDEWEYGYKVVYLPKEFENAKRRVIHLATKESFQEGMSSYSGAWHTPTEAYEAAIEYTLNNLI